MRSYGLCTTTLLFLLLVAGHAVFAVQQVPPGISLPMGAVLVEAESAETHGWQIHDGADISAISSLSGGASLIANQLDATASVSVELPAEPHVLWVRSGDNAQYYGRYGFRVTVNQREGVVVGSRVMSALEPPFGGMYWERFGEVPGGNLSLTLSEPDFFSARVDAFLFVPTRATFDPNARGTVDVLAVDAPDPARPGGYRQGIRVAISITRPRVKTNELQLGLYRERGLVWAGTAQLGKDDAGRSTVQVNIPPLDLYSGGHYVLRGFYPGFAVEHDRNVLWEFDLPMKKTQMAKCAIVTKDGYPELHIGGKPYPALAYLLHGGEREQYYGEMAKAGVKLFTFGAGIGNETEGEFNATGVDGGFVQMLEIEPEAYLFPRIAVTAPGWWQDKHPEERVLFHTGERGPQSMASDLWLEEAGAQLERYVKHVYSTPYADRVIGFHICSGVSAEWQSWGLWSDQRGDFSEPSQRAYREWLERKYGSDAALQAAWHDREVTLQTAEIPTFEERSAADEQYTLFRSPEQHQRFIDFYAFYPTVTARAIKHFAGIVKRASEGRALVVVFYGYPLQYGGRAAESQHLALADVLACPDVDFLSSPAMYNNREPGGTSTTMLPLGSVKLHGKMFFDESDLRTHRSAADATPGRAKNEAESFGIMKREFGMDMALGNACWWFDMAGGWYSGELSQLIGSMKPFFGLVNAINESQSAIQDEMRPEVAVLLDEKSFFRLLPESGFLNIGITQHTPYLARIGAPYDHYLLSDLDRVPQHKVYYFQNAFDLSDADRKAIEALKGGGRTLVFLYAAGSGRCDDKMNVAVDRDATSKLVGIELAWSDEKTKMELTPGKSQWMAGCEPNKFGMEGESSPILYCTDSEAEKLAFYADGRCGLAIKKHKDWTSVWCGVPWIPAPLLREVCRDAGAHIYSETDDSFYAGRGFVTLHAKEAGEKRIVLPKQYRVNEILGGDLTAENTDAIAFSLKQFETRCFQLFPAGGP